MHTADDPDEPDHVPRFRAVIRERFASYGRWCLMGRMESDESDTTRVTVRVPTKLVEEYEEALDDDTNRSEDIRQHMREQAKQPAADGGLVPPSDDETLAAGYHALREAAGDAPIPVEEAKSLVASRANIPKSSTSRRVLAPLHDRGYLKRCGDPINLPMLKVR